MTDSTQATTVCYRHPDRPTRLACSECGRPICVECSNDAAVGQKCPECSRAPGRHRVINARTTTGPQAGFAGAPVSLTILILTVAIYAIQFVSPDAREWLYSSLQHDNAALATGELWRMLTHALLHSQGSLMHILFNMYALYLFGPALERQVGSAPFAVFYLASAAAGSAAAFLLGPPSMLAVGASGAIFGLFGAWIYISWRLRNTAGGRSRFNQLFVLLAINLALPLFVRGIAWEAHVGGLVAGLFMAWAWGKFAVGSSNPRLYRSLIAGAVLIASFAAVAIAGPATAEAAACGDLVEDIKQTDGLGVSQRAQVAQVAFDRAFLANAQGDTVESNLCWLVANIETTPEFEDFIRSSSLEDLYTFSSQ
jgi:membrane associated rhomboid family serine protease